LNKSAIINNGNFGNDHSVTSQSTRMPILMQFLLSCKSQGIWIFFEGLFLI